MEDMDELIELSEMDAESIAPSVIQCDLEENDPRTSSPTKRTAEDFKAPESKKCRIYNLQQYRKRDDCEIFGENVACKLRKIKNEKLSLLVQRDIENLLYDALLGTGKYADVEDAPSDSSTSSSVQSQFVEVEMIETNRL